MTAPMCYPCREIDGEERPATHRVQVGNQVDDVCGHHAANTQSFIDTGDLPRDSTVTPLAT